MRNGDQLKQPKTFDEQLDILIQRNMIIEDRASALQTLQYINYYRLTAYALAFKQKDVYQDGLSFSTVYSLYEFDKKLRGLTMGMIESIEIAFRTHIAYQLGHQYGPLGYRNPSNFLSHELHAQVLSQIDSEISRSRELFVSHHQKNYAGQFPIWVAIELTSFGLLSRMYSILNNDDKKAIAASNYPGVPHHYIKSWLHSLTLIRNICAHYGRIYDKLLSIKPKLHRTDVKKGVDNRTFFSALFIIGKLRSKDTEWISFITSLAALVENYSVIDIDHLGFPNNWEDILTTL